ncbi:fused (3R)-hydroxyacyl-ACP dehydratase subunits HadA/HadB [Nocardia brasiliensis]|uniref:fused (3R)-hydroxyacyl-ACP dehydratase subunits HadA/HadB n=1 Tax=Nocardia brasiliensis TaxID=37326 RepID=UPI003D8DC9DE
MTGTTEASASDNDVAVRLRAKVGKRYRLDETYEVGREKVREFAQAVRNGHPVHRDEESAYRYGYSRPPAPPTFACVLADTAHRALSATLGYDLAWAIHTDQIFEYHRPILVGDRLTVTVALASFRQAFGGDLFVLESTIRNQQDEAVVTSHTSLVAPSASATRGDAIATLLPELLRHDVGTGPVPRFTEQITAPRPAAIEAPRSRHTRQVDTVSAGQSLPARILPISRGDLVNYAGVSGDPNPIHWHPRAAALAGLDYVVAHGMLTMGLGAGFVTDWLGDPGAITRYSVRMVSPVYVTDTPGDILFSGKVKSVDSESGKAVVALHAWQDDRRIFGRAMAEVFLARSSDIEYSQPWV